MGPMNLVCALPCYYIFPKIEGRREEIAPGHNSGPQNNII